MDLVCEGPWALCIEGGPAGEHFIQRDAERIDIRPAIHLLAPALFRGPIAERASFRAFRGAFPCPFGGPYQPETVHLHVARIVQEDVCGPDAAMENALLVGFREGGGGLPSDV